MGLVDTYLGKTLFIDTAPLIYFIEGSSEYQTVLLDIFKANAKGDIRFQTSVLTLTEVLVMPFKHKKMALAKQYETILTNSPNIDVFDMDINISKQAALIRANYNIKTPDAIQLATAIIYNADFFLTNDKQLKRVKEIDAIVLKDLIIT